MLSIFFKISLNQSKSQRGWKKSGLTWLFMQMHYLTLGSTTYTSFNANFDLTLENEKRAAKKN